MRIFKRANTIGNYSAGSIKSRSLTLMGSTTACLRHKISRSKGSSATGFYSFVLTSTAFMLVKLSLIVAVNDPVPFAYIKPDGFTFSTL